MSWASLAVALCCYCLGRHHSVLTLFVFSAMTTTFASLFILASAIAARASPALPSQLDLGLCQLDWLTTKH
ncbi:hypothetical protein DsansV1_C21g0167991 [Dioscorea sansibarensis]